MASVPCPKSIQPRSLQNTTWQASLVQNQSNSEAFLASVPCPKSIQYRRFQNPTWQASLVQNQSNSEDFIIQLGKRPLSKINPTQKLSWQASLVHNQSNPEALIIHSGKRPLSKINPTQKISKSNLASVPCPKSIQLRSLQNPTWQASLVQNQSNSEACKIQLGKRPLSKINPAQKLAKSNLASVPCP